MIRIETIAEFDAEGRFTATGQIPEPVSPGPHRIVVMVDEPPVSGSRPTVIEENGLLLLNVEPENGGDVDIRSLIEADREERIQHLLGGETP